MTRRYDISSPLTAVRSGCAQVLGGDLPPAPAALGAAAARRAAVARAVAVADAEPDRGADVEHGGDQGEGDAGPLREADGTGSPYTSRAQCSKYNING